MGTRRSVNYFENLVIKHIILTFFIASSHFKFSSARCSSGEYLSANGMCLKCPPGTYMKLENHTSDYCNPCPSPNGQKVTIHCNTSSLKIICAKGLYNSNGDKPLCQLCAICSQGQHLVAECTFNEDTICCNDGMVYNTTTRQCEKQWSSSFDYFTSSSIPTVQTQNLSSTEQYNISTTTDNLNNVSAIASGGQGEGNIALYVILPVAFIIIVIIILLCIYKRKRNRNQNRNNLEMGETDASKPMTGHNDTG